MAYEIKVENIKCGGCAGTIRTKLEALDGVSVIEVNIEQGVVNIDAADHTRDTVAARLLSLGYPEFGTAEGIAAAKAKAKSFVSCAVGRLNSD